MVPGPVALSRLDLACEPSSIRSARRHARDTLERWAVPDEVLCDALVIVSELATNAVRHTAPPIPSAVPGGGQPKAHRYSLTLWTAGLRLYIAVRDENPAPPVLRAAPDYAETGRGLRLVSTLTEGRWGYERTPERPGKQVWAALALPAIGTTACPQPVDTPGGDSKTMCHTQHQPRPHAGVVSR